MQQQLVQIWKKISQVGINKTKTASDTRNLIFTNRLVFVIFIIFSFLFLVNFINNGWSPLSKSLLFGNIAAFVLIFSLNRLGFLNYSRVVLSWMCSLYPLFASLNAKISDPELIEEVMYFMPRIFIITTAIIPILIISFREKMLLSLSLLGSVIPLVLFDPIHRMLGVGYYEMGFNSKLYPTFHAITISSYLLILTASVFFKRMNEQFEKKNLSLIDSLERKNVELLVKNAKIEKQSLELESANHEIRIINSNLEKVVNNRTKKLLDQATQFQMFSFKNSHELRAPLANVMGVIQLLREAESTEELEQLLDILNTSCHELDKVVHDINDLLNKSINDRS